VTPAGSPSSVPDRVHMRQQPRIIDTCSQMVLPTRRVPECGLVRRRPAGFGPVAIPPSRPVVSRELHAAEVGPLLEERIVDRAEGPVVTGRQHEADVGEAKASFEFSRCVFALRKSAEILDGEAVLEDGRHRPAC